MLALPVDYSEQLPDSISTCDINSGYYMLLLFVLLLFVYFIFIFHCLFLFHFHFFRDSNMISISTVEFR